MSAPSLAAFLAEDFERLGPALLARAARIDGQRLLLSGATGFFGCNLLALLHHLHQRGARFEVTALSRDPVRFLAAQPWAGTLRWLTLQRGDARQPWPAQGAHELLLHAATDTHASAHQDPAAVFDGMLAATREALAAAARAGVRRLLLTGSGAQYGRCARPAAEDDASACDPLQPGSAYGEAKRVSELLAALHAQQSGCAVVATRCFAFVGPGLDLHGHFAVGNFLRDVLAGQPLRLNSDGQALRSYLYGADLALWLLLLLLEAPGGTAVNVGSDQALSVRALAERARDLLQPGLNVQLGPPTPADSRSVYLPDITRARNLGLDVWTPLDLALTRTARWHRAPSS